MDIRTSKDRVCEYRAKRGILAGNLMFKSLISLAFLFAGAAAAAQSTTAEVTYLSCAVCHGDGQGEGQGDDAIPAIRGRPHDVLLASLSGFAAEAGTATIMHRFIAALTPAEIDALARHISGLEGVAR